MSSNKNTITDEQAKLVREWASNPVAFSKMFENLGIYDVCGTHPGFMFECCAETKLQPPTVFSRVGCASRVDLERLGFAEASMSEYGNPEKKQRSACQCFAKKQIL